MSKPKIAVVGASGFVGTALVEALVAAGDVDVAPFIHSAGNAWGLARLGLELETLDIMDRARVDDALADCSHVVNCSRGDDAVMIDGLSNLLRAAGKRQVTKFVHLSSVAVYGDPPSRDSERETGTTRPEKGSYGWIKLRQDNMVAKAAAAGLPAVTLCPPNISGPASDFLQQVLNALSHNQLVLLDDGSAPCNLVDVRDLARAIVLALDSSISDGSRTFIVGCPDATWRDVCSGLEPLAVGARPLDSMTREAFLSSYAPESKPAVSISRSLKHLVSGEVRAALRQDPLWAKVDRLVRSVPAMLGPRVEDRLRLMTQGALHVEPVREGPELHARLCAQQLRTVRHSAARARDVLAFEAVHDLQSTLAAFDAWCRVLRGMDDPSWALSRWLYGTR